MLVQISKSLLMDNNLRKRSAETKSFKKPEKKLKKAESESEDEDIQVDFILVTPSPQHFEGVSNILRVNFFPHIPSYNDLVKEIVEQDWLGCIVEIEGDETEGEGETLSIGAYGVCSAIRMDEYSVPIHYLS